MNFRSDINGLRAYAVMAVVLFHFGVPYTQGGFAGVDVFFVISGFLMTGIIFNGIEKERFSVVRFYFDRARRIVPALAFLCFTLLSIGYFVLTPPDYEALGKHVASSMLFVSNVIFSNEAGYFDQASHEKWLLHTWSLSVEWQFYMIYPLVIVALRKWLKVVFIRWLILCATVLSFMLAIYASVHWPTPAFYWLPTRTWELLVGSLVYLFPVSFNQIKSTLIEWVGIGLILFSVFYISVDVAWPSTFTVLPVLGAALVIISGQKKSPLTSNLLVQFLGKTSYSIYLWHWPFVVALNYLTIAKQTQWIIGGVLASIIAGYLSYSYIEGFASKKKGVSQEGSKPQLKVISVWLFVGVYGMCILILQGIPKRMDSNFNSKTQEIVMPLRDNGWCFYSVSSIKTLRVGSEGLHCELGNKNGHLNGLLFGDSYAGHNEPFWSIIANDNDMKINAVTTNWCYPSLTKDFPSMSDRSYQQCLMNRKYLYDHISDYDLVVFSGLWSAVYSKNKMQEVYDVISFAASRTKLVVLMPSPTTFDINIKRAYERSLILGQDFDIAKIDKEKDNVTRKANESLKHISLKYNNVLYFERDSLFNINGMPSDITKDGMPYSLDGNHISVYGSKMSAYAFKKTQEYNKFREMMHRL